MRPYLLRGQSADHGAMKANRRMETPAATALVAVGVLSGILAGGLVASDPPSAASVPGQRIGSAPAVTPPDAPSPGAPFSPSAGTTQRVATGGDAPVPRSPAPGIDSGGMLPNDLYGVSCVGPNTCAAVGNYVGALFAPLTMIGSQDDTAWSVVANPTPVGGGFLDGVSCTSATNCVAVGYHGYEELGTLAESWNGTAWSVMPSPTPGNDGGTLNSVSCTSSTNCVAVGDYGEPSLTQALIESWDGTSWSVVPSPMPGNHGSLKSVSCTSATNCVAVGYYANDSDVTQTVIESWDGSHWSVVTSPSAGSLDGVSCTSPTSCVAVGARTNASSTTQTLVESWDGVSWSVVSSPNKDPDDDSLTSVSCTSSTNCTAVGVYERSPVVEQALIERWDGMSWSLATSPGTGASSDLEGVSCTSPSSCVAVGALADASGITQTLIESWNGNTWSVVPSPNVGILVPPVVGMASTPAGDGYWLVDSSGNVTTHGAAVNYGSMGGTVLNAPVTHIVATPDGRGYWLVAADGGTFAFGDARFYGSMGGKRLNAPVVDIAPTPDGRGYWLVASDGGVFAFGDAVFSGSMGGTRPQPTGRRDRCRQCNRRLLAGGLRRWDLQLRRAVPRIDRSYRPEPAGRIDGIDLRWPGLLVHRRRRRRVRVRRRWIPRIHGWRGSQLARGGHGGRRRHRRLLAGGLRRRGVQLRGPVLRRRLTTRRTVHRDSPFRLRTISVGFCCTICFDGMIPKSKEVNRPGNPRRPL